jgi:hypothetical protein
MPRAEFYFKLFINLIGRDINLRADIEWIGIKFGRTDSFAIFLLMIRPITISDRYTYTDDVSKHNCVVNKLYTICCLCINC